jgi:hypothetical protein
MLWLIRCSGLLSGVICSRMILNTSDALGLASIIQACGVITVPKCGRQNSQTKCEDLFDLYVLTLQPGPYPTAIMLPKSGSMSNVGW